MSDDDSSNSGCSICCEEYGKKRYEIICCMCDVSTCSICIRKYLVSSSQDAHCMSCKKMWSKQFMQENLTKSWLVGDYRKSRQKLYLDREKSLLPSTMPIATAIINAENQRKELYKELEELRKQENKIRIKIAKCTEVITGKVQAEKNTSYMFPCSKEGCKGYIESQTWKCGLCKTKICKSCHVIKDDDDHECDKNDVKTAKMIMKDTKPCPTCKTRIHKISGCDQIFCTNCHSAWSWDKGTIETGVIHNPHYFDLQRKMGVVPRTRGDIVCGGINNTFLTRLEQHPFYNTFRDMVQRTGEIHTRITQLQEKDFLPLRIEYLRGKISDQIFKSNIFRVERANEKIREERQILETFRVSMIERFNDLAETDRITDKILREKIVEVKQIVNFCNTAFEENYKAMGLTAYPKIDLTQWYGARKTGRAPREVERLQY